jgi:hypothetical protein
MLPDEDKNLEVARLARQVGDIRDGHHDIFGSMFFTYGNFDCNEPSHDRPTDFQHYRPIMYNHLTLMFQKPSSNFEISELARHMTRTLETDILYDSPMSSMLLPIILAGK